MNVMNVSNGLVRLNSQAFQAKSALELKNAAQQQSHPDDKTNGGGRLA